MKKYLKRVLVWINDDGKVQMEPVITARPEHEGAFEDDSGTWLFIQHNLHDQLERLHLSLEKVSNTEQQTAAIRGEIKAIRNLLALPKDLQVQKDARAQDDSSYVD